MPTIRDYRADDLEALHDIALRTGDGGADASTLLQATELLGVIYAAPYAAFEPELALVIEDEAGVAGYCLGTLNTHAFERRLERRWWPELRTRYPATRGSGHAPRTDFEGDLVGLIHHPSPSSDWLVERYPSHLHVNLLPRLQGRGCGRRVLAAWQARARALGSPGFHLGVGTANARAIGFYGACGLDRLRPPGQDGSEVVWFGKRLLPG